jgi:hypothetical protein
MARTIPFSFTDGEIADASEVNQNFAAVGSFFGDLRDSDFAADADLDGNKLSPTSGKRVPATRLETNAATDRVLASDASAPGSDALRAVSGDHIKALTVAALARFMPAGGITPTMLQPGGIPLDGLKITVHSVAFTTGIFTGAGTQTVNPTSTFPKATYELEGIYVKNVTNPSGGTPASALCPIPDDTGTNWAGAVRITRLDTGSVGGSLVYVFISRT